ncbi:uncharacterized protein ACA1_142120 [Acanthamoeba castellanii str. Neff]|uniref:Uncharacterized protein n=1 Tax=Acanthamoeba castellanii (strain ATCC 30010 / Neff) TaxID=1257118 RepID=L8HDQ5_ACACF|nr:uncharacterized protein ACA1_142120 [Acanthamoeba castellanii str. Neff]ELR22521.1 hypothetical protein ACA1_142120 [Acanthamoeba castellanii str. Neff]
MSVYGRTHEHGAPELHHQSEEDDDWETDPDGKEVQDLHSLRQQVTSQHETFVAQDFSNKKHEVGSSYGQDKLRN